MQKVDGASKLEQSSKEDQSICRVIGEAEDASASTAEGQQTDSVLVLPRRLSRRRKRVDNPAKDHETGGKVSRDIVATP